MTRGFPDAEYEARTARAQARMKAAGLSALWLTSEADIRYFTGFLTRFWESPSRPWHLVVPVRGKPIAVIPSIGAALMRQSWIEDIRTWSAPDPVDDGVSLLAGTLREQGGRVAMPMGYETQLRMPLTDFIAVGEKSGVEITHDQGLVAGLRAIKSAAEIDKIAQSAAIAGRAFARVPQIAAEGVPLAQVFRDFQRLLLEEGADFVPYLAGGAGPDGYGDVISPASDAPLRRGDVLMLDTGAIRDGYFCDFDRNFAVGAPSDAAASAHARLIEATQAAFALARPGARACDLWRAMADIVGGGDEAGRLGHGLGMQLTEGINITRWDETRLAPGMVITLEPGIEIRPGTMMVHEENIAITQDAPRALSPLADPALPVI